MENKKRNRKYLDMLEDKMFHKLGGQSILYIVKGILISGLPMEECWGFNLLNNYLDKLNHQNKIEYFMQHIESLQKGMMDKIDDEKTLLFAVKEALVSKQPLKKCPGYDSLQKYFKKEDVSQTLDQQQASLILLNMLSNIVSIMDRGQDSEQVGRIVSYYPYIETNQGESQKKKSYSA